jgi:hypothetical protein
MICPKCGCEYRDGYKYCANCEIKLVDQFRYEDNNDKKPKTFTYYYKIAWCILNVLIICAKLYTLERGEELSFNLISIYTVLVWIPLAFTLPDLGKRLENYLATKYPYDNIRLKNSFGQYKMKALWYFIKGKRERDKVLFQLGEEVKKGIWLIIFVFCSIPVMWIILNAR